MNDALIDRRFSAPVAHIIKSGTISPEDVRTLRQDVFDEGITKAEQAHTLISLEKYCINACQSWTDYYVTALSDFLLCHMQPSGMIDDAKCAWINDFIMRHGCARTDNELRLMKVLLERAMSATPEFCKMVLTLMHTHMDEIVARHSHGSRALDQKAHDFDVSLVDIIDQLNQNDLFL